jgi:hypothetical protein
MHVADHEIRLIAVQAITRLPIDDAKVLYQDLVVAASAAAKSGAKFSLDEALERGWEVYRRALVEHGDASQAQAVVERWFSDQTDRFST